MKSELVDLSAEVWRRLRQRVDGLTNEEYDWEPVPGCWSVRSRADGTRHHDVSVPPPDPIPPTTIAWRLWHLIDLYGEDRIPNWLGVAPQGDAVGLDDPTGSGPPATAADAVALLERAHARFEAHLALVSERALSEPVGSLGGAFAARTRRGFVLHMLDEYIHHGAEIGVLRDLFRWQRQLDADSIRERVMRGDRTVVEVVGRPGNDGSGLVDLAARYGRWELVADLVTVGAPLMTSGITPLHRAAGSGELSVVQLLIDHGADPSARDPEFSATPHEWALFLNQVDVAEWLAGQRSDGAAPES